MPRVETNPAAAGFCFGVIETLCFKVAGGSPAAGDFLLLAQKKVTKEKGTLARRPLRGFPALLGGSQGLAPRVCAGTDELNGFRLFFRRLPCDGFFADFIKVGIPGKFHNPLFLLDNTLNLAGMLSIAPECYPAFLSYKTS